MEEWPVKALIVVFVVLVVLLCIVIGMKLYTRSKLRDIDGIVGVTTKKELDRTGRSSGKKESE